MHAPILCKFSNYIWCLSSTISSTRTIWVCMGEQLLYEKNRKNVVNAKSSPRRPGSLSPFHSPSIPHLGFQSHNLATMAARFLIVIHDSDDDERVNDGKPAPLSPPLSLCSVPSSVRLWLLRPTPLSPPQSARPSRAILGKASVAGARRRPSLLILPLKNYSCM
jgi:hypothetical protein